MIREEALEGIDAYARIPCAFRIESVVTIGAGSILSETPAARPRVKDYDTIPGNHPRDWSDRFDTANWRMLIARNADEPVGGAVLACRAPELDLLEGRADTAILWDLRVVPKCRRQGIATALFLAARRWAGERACSSLLAETQDINVPACRFYARMGCTLAAAEPHAYPDFPDESRLLWRCAPYHIR